MRLPVSYWFIAPEPCEWLAPLDQSMEPPAFRLALKPDDAEPIHIRGLGDFASLPVSVLFIGSGLIPPPAPCGELTVAESAEGARAIVEMTVRTDRSLMDGLTHEMSPLELRVDLEGLIVGERGGTRVWDRAIRPSLAITSAMLRSVDLTNPAYRAHRVWRGRHLDDGR